ncbi:DNA-binding response regulator [Aureitalea marina]|uniref:DNA-binding response regulator n=2 Tax=Aureitalea marina TaxID=930804 RepID=A0A2S7KTI9_9FLAO|nr:DNA-binding response regulator [Aureitalea marina]
MADDEELFRVGLSHILNRYEDVDILFEADNGQSLMEQLAEAEELPDIVVMDIKMPEMNGVEATKMLRKEYPDINIIALTTYNTKPFIRNMIDVGACAYLVKNSAPQEVIHTIRQVYSNGFYYDKLVMESIRSNKRSTKPKGDKTSANGEFITDREKQILELICRQYTSQEIAQKLFISKRTVEVHRKNLLDKTQSKNIAGLVVYALKNELVPNIIIE